MTARVAAENGGFIARLEQLSLEGSGDSLQAAQDELILALRAWIETQEGQDNLEQALAQAGFPGVEEETEVQLEFVD